MFTKGPQRNIVFLLFIWFPDVVVFTQRETMLVVWYKITRYHYWPVKILIQGCQLKTYKYCEQQHVEDKHRVTKLIISSRVHLRMEAKLNFSFVSENIHSPIKF